MKTRPATRSGCSAASTAAHRAPQDTATTTARVGRGGVHDCEGIGGELFHPIAVGPCWTVGAAIAPTVEGDDSRVAGEIRDLHLPHAGRDDGPGGKQEHRWVAVAVHLVVDSHTVAFEITVGVGVPGPRLFAGPADSDSLEARQCQGLASNTMLKGVSATRVNLVKPALSTISRMRASPAWAPRARPTG